MEGDPGGGRRVPGTGLSGSGRGLRGHHPNAWADGGATDLSNLSLLCARHHAEVHEGLWDVEVRDGIPWIRPPAWIRPDRPLLRNLAHRRTA